MRRIHTDEPEVIEGPGILRALRRGYLLHRPKEDAGITLDADVIDMRIVSGKREDELSFPHADLDVYGIMISKYFLRPALAMGRTVLNDERARA